MKKLNQLTLLLIFSFNIQASYAEQKTIRVATEGAYKPWSYKDASGKLIGYELDLASDLCKRMQVKCEIIETA